MRMATEESICLEELDDTLKEIYYQKEKLNNLMFYSNNHGNVSFDIELEIDNTRNRIESLEKWRTHLESKTFGI